MLQEPKEKYSCSSEGEIPKPLLSRFSVLFEHSKFYWVCLILATILCYGFTLTNYSVGHDDSLFSRYIENGTSIAQGRWGYNFWKMIFDVFEFLPFWEDFFAVTLMFFGTLVWAYLLKKVSKGKFDEIPQTIFSCAMMTFPYIAYHFIFMINSIERGIVFIFIPTALLVFYDIIEIKFTVKRAIMFVLLVLTAGTGIKSACAPPLFLLGGFFMMALLMIMYAENSREKYTIKKCVLIGLKFAALFVIVYILDYFTAKLFQHIHNVKPNNYVDSYMAWDFSQGRRAAFLDFAKNAVNRFFRLPLLWKISAIIIGISSLTASVVFAVRKKQPSLILAALGVIISPYVFVIYSGNLSSTATGRVFAPAGLAFAYILAMFYMLTRNVAVWKIQIKAIIGFLCVLVVIQQTKLSNEIYFDDYLRYQYDLQIMSTVVNDISASNPYNKPIVFVGQLNQSKNSKSRSGKSRMPSLLVAGGRQISLSGELAATNFFNTMRLLGYEYTQATNLDNDKLREQFFDMPVYPKDGYVKNTGDYIIIKLSEESLLSNLPNKPRAVPEYDPTLRDITDIYQYLDKIKNPDYSVLITVKDDASSSFNDDMDGKMKALGLQQNLKGKFQIPYAAVIDKGNILYEDVGKTNKAQLKSEGILSDGTPYAVYSAGYPSTNRCQIIVGDKEYGVNSRGINIVVYDNKTRKVIDSVAFDTFQKSAPASRRDN
ncbi:hypothetical protein AGMMS49975_07700 [Clostridia bacterium]|nr:hypothetical protein AGMMS49975_07700 [Clostridia bacterium]